jgi:hypothetical protein
MQIHILMCPMTMKLKFWAVSVMSPQLFHVNSCLGIIDLKMVIDNSESVVEVVSSITDDVTKHLFTEQSDLYRCQHSQWNVSLRTLKWSNITTDETRKFLGLTIMMGQVRKDNIRE